MPGFMRIMPGIRARIELPGHAPDQATVGRARRITGGRCPLLRAPPATHPARARKCGNIRQFFLVAVKIILDSFEVF